MSGGGSKQPKNTTSTTTTIPKYAEPYAMQMLGQANALTNMNMNPYQYYEGNRVAGFSPLQQQSFQGVAGMGPSGQLGQATGLAGIAGLGGLNTGRFTDPGVAQSYMSPYMQNVVDVQQQEAQRQAAIANRQIGANAATSGAFGGSRHALENSEANRNLALQLGSIQAKGLQDAYSQAQNTFNQDESRRLQGLGIAGQSAGILGQLGQNQYEQQMGIYNTQNQFGQQQQNLQQMGLNYAYQDFLDQQNYPYKQLGFMSDLLHGLPTNQSTSVYAGPPNMWGQAAGIAGGLGSLFMAGQS